MGSYYFKIQILFIALTISSTVINFLSKKNMLKLNYLTQLQFLYFMIVLVFILPWGVELLPRHSYESFTFIKLESAQFLNARIESRFASAVQSFIDTSYYESNFLNVLIILLLIMSVSLVVYELVSLKKFIKSAVLHKKIGRLTILKTRDFSIPAVFSFMRNSYVFIPYNMKSQEDLSNSLKHELQHIRQNDTFWIYIVVSLKRVFFLNPFVHILCQKLKSLQELACDEELLAQKKVQSKSYALTLLNLSTQEDLMGFVPSLTTGILKLNKKTELRRRIVAMKEKTKNKIAVTGFTFLCCIGAVLLTAVYTQAVQEKNEAVQLNMVIEENGKVTARPKVITFYKEIATIAVQKGTVRHQLLVVPTKENRAGQKYVTGQIQYQQSSDNQTPTLHELRLETMLNREQKIALPGTQIVLKITPAVPEVKLRPRAQD